MEWPRRRRVADAGDIDRFGEARSRECWEQIAALEFRTDHRLDTDAIATLARRYKLSAYDAAYLDLAMREGLPLASVDAGLCAAAKKAGVALYLAGAGRLR